ncbi:hypothetical protein [Bacillus halotolerans]|uniref:hypothetical protein n=1 Tax=Bacillus halotolerans TaxID=260554 RepID=UPI003D1A3234
MNIGDIMFQLIVFFMFAAVISAAVIVFFMFAAVISAAVIGSTYAKNRKAQLDRIEKKLNSMSEDQND